MLVDVWEHHTTVLLRRYPVQILNQGILVHNVVQVFCSSIVRLLVLWFLDLDPEHESRVDNVLSVVVINSRSDNVLIRHPLDMPSAPPRTLDSRESIRCWPA